MKHLAVTLALLGLAPFAQAQEEYTPLKEGFSWTYRTNDKTGKNPGKFTMRVKAKEKVGDVDCFKVVTETIHGESAEWMAVTKEGVKCYKRAQGKNEVVLDAPEMTLRFPLKVGDAWDAKVKSSSDGISVESESHYKVEGEEEVTVSAGKFKAFKVVVKDSQSGSVTASWIAKDTGLVQQVTEFAGQTFTSKLEKFEKGKAPGSGKK